MTVLGVKPLKPWLWFFSPLIAGWQKCRVWVVVFLNFNYIIIWTCEVFSWKVSLGWLVSSCTWFWPWRWISSIGSRSCLSCGCQGCKRSLIQGFNPLTHPSIAWSSQQLCSYPLRSAPRCRHAEGNTDLTAICPQRFFSNCLVQQLFNEKHSKWTVSSRFPRALR